MIANDNLLNGHVSQILRRLNNFQLVKMNIKRKCYIYWKYTSKVVTHVKRNQQGHEEATKKLS